MEQQNKETYWSQFAEEFDEKQSFVAGKEILTLIENETLKENNLGRVLELGCGTGQFTVALIDKASDIVATDFSDEMIEIAKKKRGNLKNVKFEKANALNLHYDAESFNTVFMANLIHVIGDADRVVQESSRVLRKGGLIIITSFAIEEMRFFNKLSMAFRYLKTFGKFSKEATKEKTSRKNVERMLTNNGFKIIKSIVIGKKSKAIYIKSKKTSI